MRAEESLDRSDSRSFEADRDVKGGEAAAQRATLDVPIGFKHDRPSDQGSEPKSYGKCVTYVPEHLSPMSPVYTTSPAITNERY